MRLLVLLLANLLAVPMKAVKRGWLMIILVTCQTSGVLFAATTKIWCKMWYLTLVPPALIPTELHLLRFARLLRWRSEEQVHLDESYKWAKGPFASAANMYCRKEEHWWAIGSFSAFVQREQIEKHSLRLPRGTRGRKNRSQISDSAE